MPVEIDPIASLVALVAIGIAIWSNTIARQSATAAKVSASEARRSSDAAEEANAHAVSERARTVETQDVEWAMDRSRSDKILTIRNVGSTTAFSVTAMIRLGDMRVDLEPGDVPSDGTFTCDTSAASDDARARHQRTQAAMDASGVLYLGVPGFRIEARVTWQSQLGTPGVVVLRSDKRKR